MNGKTSGNIHVKKNFGNLNPENFFELNEEKFYTNKKPLNEEKSKNSQNISELKIKSNEVIESMNQNELEKFLHEVIFNNNGISKLDLSELIENKKIHFNIYNIILNNFPIVGISRLIEDQKIVDITFMKIKTLNDLIGKEIVDLFIGKLKIILKNNFNQIIDGERPGRLIRDNYKHLTFSVRKDLDLSKKIFNNQKSIDDLIDEVLNSISEIEFNKSIQLSGKNNLSQGEIKKILKDVFTFGIGSSIIKGKSNKDKLKSFYMGEISSRNKANLDELGEDLNYDFSRIQKFANEIIKIENNIINKYKGEKFIYENTNYDIVINGKISPLLLKYVRKGENVSINKNLSKLNGELNLESEIQQYIEHLTNGFDFISPVIYEDDFENVNQINEQIGNGKIDIKYLQKNFKKTLSTQGLNSYSRNKSGLRIFVDIVDMGIMNLADFRELALKVNSGEINENNFDELLKAGFSVTEKFQYLVKSIKKNYPGSKISLGGDEIFIFIPGENKGEELKIINNISKNINKFGLKGRISSSIENKNKNIFENLDSLTSINKIFEKYFNHTIHNSFSGKSMGHSDIIVTNLEIIDIKFIYENLSVISNLLEEELGKLNFEKLIFEGNTLNHTINFKIKNKKGELVEKSIIFEIKKEKNYISIKIS